MPGQLATVMYRNYMKTPSFDSSILDKNLSPGDRLLYFSLLCNGKIYCMQEKMSAYRHITTHGSSFSATNKFIFKNVKAWQQELIKYAIKHSSIKEVKISEYQLLNLIIRGYLKKQITLKQAMCEFAEIKYKFSAVLIGIKRIINKKILHKKLYS